MTSRNPGTPNSQSVRTYYHDRVKDSEFNGLPIPFNWFVVPQNGDSAGKQLSLSTYKALLTVEGDWMVVEESPKGYPAALHNQSKDAAVAATLNTVGENRFWNAFLGYADDVGTFAVAEIQYSRYSDYFNQFATIDSTDSLAEMLQTYDGNTPFLWEWELEGKSYSHTFMCHRVDGHNPWKVLKRCHLEGFAALRERYQTAVGVIGKRFNPVRPNERGHPSQQRGQDTSKAVELQEMYKEMLSEDRNTEHGGN
jgi:hypothetical protein